MANFVGDNNAIPGVVAGAVAEPETETRQLEVRAGGMTLRGLDPGGLRPGDQVLAFVRPENIEVLAHAPAAGAPNVVRGR